MNFFVSLIIIIIAAIIVAKSNWLVHTFGYSGWAEAKMGTWGGTRMMIKLIGMAIILLTLLHMAGLLDNIILSIFSPFSGSN